MKKSGVEIERLPPILTVARVAEIAGVARRTVRDWARRGRLPASRMTANGSARLYFKTVDVLRALGVEAET